MTGIVNEASLGSIIVTPKGERATIRYHIGRETKYTPHDYRAIAGDTVSINYYEKTSRTGGHMLVASTMTLVKTDPDRKDLTSPAQGIVDEVGRMGNIRITYPSFGITISLGRKRGCKYTPVGYAPQVGDKVEVHFEEAVNRWTGGKSKVITAIKKL